MTAAKNAATEAFEAFTNANPEAFKEGYEKLAKSMTNFTEINKGAVEALMASAGVVTRGVERVAAEHNAFLKTIYEDGVAAFKATAASKSVQEIVSIQAEYVRVQTEKNLSQFTKLSEHWSAIAKEASEPVTQRYGEMIERVQSFRP